MNLEPHCSTHRNETSLKGLSQLWVSVLHIQNALSQHRRRHSKNPGVCLGYCNTVIPADLKLRTFLVSWPSYCLWSNMTIWKHSHTHSLVWSSQHSSEVGRASNINFITQREKLKFTKMKYLATGHLTAGIASRAFSCFPLPSCLCLHKSGEKTPPNRKVSPGTEGFECPGYSLKTQYWIHLDNGHRRDED